VVSAIDALGHFEEDLHGVRHEDAQERYLLRYA
jgi:hypothetical protein